MPITLSTYETAVRQLMQPAWSGLIPTVTLDSYINTARSQLAIDAECIRSFVVFDLPSGQGTVTFVFLGGSLPPGASGVIAVREMFIQSAGWPMESRSWEWYWNYKRIDTFATGQPVFFAQLGQGANGTIYLHPFPDKIYTFEADVTLLPQALLADNSVVEAIPYPWTDAVPFYAAWLGFQQVQRQADAQMMLARYKELALRGRQGATGTVLPENYQGGTGAKIASSRSTLTMAPQQPALGG